MPEPRSIELRDKQFEYLREMAEKYGLSDSSKAARVLIEFAIHEADEEARIFSEIRCAHC